MSNRARRRPDASVYRPGGCGSRQSPGRKSGGLYISATLNLYSLPRRVAVRPVYDVPDEPLAAPNVTFARQPPHSSHRAIAPSTTIEILRARCGDACFIQFHCHATAVIAAISTTTTVPTPSGPSVAPKS